MLLEQVQRIRVGDLVSYKGEVREITAVIVANTASPQFLLTGSADGAVSYRLVDALPTGDVEPAPKGKVPGAFDLPLSQARGYYP